MTIADIKRRTKELFLISAPMIVEQTAIMAMGIVSTWLVNSVGEYAVTAVGMVDSISNLIIAMFAALTTGGTIVVAQYIGRKEYAKAKSSAGQALFLSVAFSAAIVLFMLVFQRPIINVLFGKADSNVIEAANQFMLIVTFSYPILAVTQTIFGILRGSGNTGTPMIISMSMNVINLGLGIALIRGVDFWFIHMPGFGVRGVAFALLLARVAGLLMSGWYILRKAKVLRLNSTEYFRPDTQIQKNILGFGVPTSVESSLFSLGKLVTMVYIVGMGTAASAANSIGSSIAGFINVPGSAFATGVMILIGQRIGRGETDDVKTTSTFAVVFGMVMLGILCLLCVIFQKQILGLYTLSPETYDYLIKLLLVLFISTPFLWPVSFITPAALRATGDVRYTMVVAVFSMWMFRIVLGYVFGVWLRMGVYGVWLAMITDWLVRGVLFYWRLLNGRWKNKGIK